MESRLQKKYKTEVVKTLQKTFNYKSAMQAPRITKITLNMGLGEAVEDKKIINNPDFNLLYQNKINELR